MGAIRVPGHADVLLDATSGAVATGAELVTGGRRVTVLGRRGDYLAPTVLQMRRPGRSRLVRRAVRTGRGPDPVQVPPHNPWV
jgi:acyl-CoA reductase-like NAD-dependent aldehyde dehydrogenase